MEINAKGCAERLRKMDNVVILCHCNPDGDTLGSAFALYYMFEYLGKTSRVECGDGLPKRYSFMFPNYVPKDFEPEYIVAVDIADEKLFGEKLDKYCGKVDLCIDHHDTNKHYAKDWYVNPKAAANAENMEEVCAELGIPVSKKIADCIYTGVSTDTGCFCYSNTTSHSHETAKRMMDAGCDFANINRVMFEIKSQSRIALEKEVLNIVEYHFERRCALIYITKDMMERTGALEAELEGMAAMPRQIEGVEVGIMIRERENDYKISLRTGEELDASEVCGRLGGGGHKRASGCNVSGTLDEAKAAILREVGKSMGFGEEDR